MSNSFNNWEALANALEPACTEAVSDTARKGKEHFRSQIQSNGQVRTGTMLNSVYASTPEGSDYHGGEKMLPEEKPSSKTEAVIGVAAEYAIFNDMGTVHMSGKPIAAPAMDRTRQDFDAALEGVARKLAQFSK
jgi:HK97 gp10 family phage protein